MVKNLIILFMSIYLAGCASGAKLEYMAYQGSKNDYPIELKNNVEVSSVVGGIKTNSLAKSEISNGAFLGALKKSLLSQGLFSEKGKYQLAAKIMRVDQPLVGGFNMEVTTHVVYILTDSSNSKIIFKEKIISSYTASATDAFIGANRLRLANEGSGKNNIELFLKKISSLNIRKKEITLTE